MNADVTVLAQAPRISTYTEAMRENIAAVLKLDKSRINIKGTTTERLGFVGRKEGIAAEAVCSIRRLGERTDEIIKDAFKDTKGSSK